MNHTGEMPVINLSPARGLERIPDWCGLLMSTNSLLQWCAQKCILLLTLLTPDISAVENFLRHVPVWINAFASVLGVVFLIAKHWPAIKMVWWAVFGRRIKRGRK